MAGSGKKRTTMAKLTRESRLRERRLDKRAKKDARKLAPAYDPYAPPAENPYAPPAEIPSAMPDESDPTGSAEHEPVVQAQLDS
jgi:hypothetical protein